MHIGIQIESPDSTVNNTQSSGIVISLALLEEIEIICSLMQQVFEHAEMWRARDEYMFCEMKDYFLFAVPKLLTKCNTRGLLPASMTEEHLKSITQDFILGVDNKRETEMTGLEFRAELCL